MREEEGEARQWPILVAICCGACMAIVFSLGFVVGLFVYVIWGSIILSNSKDLKWGSLSSEWYTFLLFSLSLSHFLSLPFSSFLVFFVFFSHLFFLIASLSLSSQRHCGDRVHLVVCVVLCAHHHLRNPLRLLWGLDDVFKDTRGSEVISFFLSLFL
jgi:hypothetical protein